MRNQLIILKSKAGVTVLEGVIALGLLALVMAGSFGVLLSTSRQTVQPDIYEEMVFAVEKANNLLKEYVYSANLGGNAVLTTKAQKYQLKGDKNDKDYRQSICGTNDFYDLSCLLPAVCDLNNNSSFTFEVVSLSNNPSFKTNWPTTELAASTWWEGQGNPQMNDTLRDTTNYTDSGNVPTVGIQYSITCNGYEL